MITLDPSTPRHKAEYWQAVESSEDIRCALCYKGCRIKPGETGICGVRENREGALHAGNYGRISSMGMDPIEKKPLYHFYPGSQILSVGTVGCNLKCSFCQNHSISQDFPETRYMSPESLADLAVEYSKGEGNCIGVAFTYSEPMVWFEYVMDAGKAIRDRGMKSVLVTNGTIEDDPLRDLLKVTDAMNIDLKAFQEDYYRKVCQGSLERVKRTISLCAGETHVELTTLVVTGLNDSEEETEALTKWVAKVDPRIPLHISRYFPRYKMDLPPTPEETMERLWKVAKTNLPYTYLGNVGIAGSQDTVCPECSNPVITRGYGINDSGLKPPEAGATGLERSPRCRVCGHGIPVIMG